MKTIGLIGGTGWISTIEYYRLINQGINDRVGGLNAARCLLYSFNYADIADLNQKNDHAGVLKMVTDAAQKLEGAGVDCIALCANTLHFYADDLQNKISKPIVHIGSATADKIREKGLTKVGLLGTKITMEEDFYKNRLSNFQIQTLIPNNRERAFIHRSIFTELIKNIFIDKTKEQFLQIMSNLKQEGAEGIILGCTEIPLLITQSDINIPVFNTLEIHVKAIVDFALCE
ncbi:MAG: aspartate/glutamate racemase family protein [Bacteroidales bacterium]|nr:aspartate/glutamate racemase family protein [Bacteroidales bacterium]